jgi:two-component system response regulator AlgR
VQMPKLDGFEVLELLDPGPAVVFSTAYDEYALKAFEVHAVDYLVKPIRLGRLFDALSRVRTITPLRLDVLRELKTEARTHLSINERGRIHLIPVNDIAFLKAELKYVTARTAEREFLLEESLAKLEQEFLGRFVRIHRNCLVAKDAVRGFERATDVEGEGHWVVVLKNISEKLDVSRRHQHIVREFGKML